MTAPHLIKFIMLVFVVGGLIAEDHPDTKGIESKHSTIQLEPKERSIKQVNTKTIKKKIQTENATSSFGKIALGHLSEGILDFHNDQDTFTVNLKKGSVYQISIFSHGPKYIDLDIAFSKEKEFPVTFDLYDNEPVETKYLAKNSGLHYISIQSRYANSLGKYNFMFEEVSFYDDHLNDKSTDSIVYSNQPFTGTIDYSHDEDWFKVYLNKDTNYRLTSGYDDVSLNIFSNDSFIKTKFDINKAENIQTYTFTSQSAGYHYIRVSSYGDIKEYRILLEQFEDVSNTSSNPTSLPEQIQMDTIYKNEHGSYNNHDTFKIYMLEGEEYTFSELFDDDLDNSSYLKITPTKIDYDEFEIKFQTKNKARMGNYNVWSFIPKSSKEYFFNLSTNSPKYQFSVTTGYAISNIIPEAEPLFINEPVTGTWKEVKGFKDYKLHLSAGEYVILNAGGDIYELNVISPTGDEKSYFPKNAESQKIGIKAKMEGDYHIYIYGDGFGGYYLNANTAHYNDDYDDYGDTTNSASKLVENKILEGKIDYLNDQDWFNLNFDQAGNYLVYILTNELKSLTVKILNKSGETKNTFGYFRYYPNDKNEIQSVIGISKPPGTAEPLFLSLSADNLDTGEYSIYAEQITNYDDWNGLDEIR